MNCPTCGAATMPCLEWRHATAEERAVRREMVNGQCRRCYDGDRRGPRKSWKLIELIEEAEHLLDGGVTQHDAAGRLGLKPESLVRAFKRGKARGLTTREMHYHRRNA